MQQRLSTDKPLVSATVEVIDKLRWNCHLGKHQHFEASKRSRKLHKYFGIPPIFIGLALSSVFFVYAGEKILPTHAKLIGSGLALVSAWLTGIQTFFNFQRGYEGHRAIGNRYLVIARECERLIALHIDGVLPLVDLSANIESLNKQYSEINKDSEAFVVRNRDYQKALFVQNKKVNEEESIVDKIRKTTKDSFSSNTEGASAESS